MFILGLVATLLTVLFLGLTILRLRKNRPSPNAMLLVDLINSVASSTPTERPAAQAPDKPSALFMI